MRSLIIWGDFSVHLALFSITWPVQPERSGGLLDYLLSHSFIEVREWPRSPKTFIIFPFR
jgi:hypothetical protein